MTRQQKFVLLSALLITGRAYDFTTTLIYTPTLANESNFLVSVFGMGLLPMVALQVLLLAAIVVCLYYYCIVPVHYPGHKGISHSTSLLYNMLNAPMGLRYTLYSLGYIVGFSLIGISYTIGTSTLLLITSPAYKVYYRAYGTTLAYIMLLCWVVFFTWRFYKRELPKVTAEL